MIVVTAILITWSDWIVGSFKLNHPEVYTLADVGQIIWGPGEYYFAFHLYDN